MQAFFDELAAKKGVVLSDQQRAAVEQTQGPALMVATPGSGKTTVIVCRTAGLMRVRGVPPGRILTLTYGKQSQLDMDRRFSGLFPELPKPRFSTIHALCLEMLRRYAALTGGEMFSLLTDSASAVRRLLVQQTGGYVGEEMLNEAMSRLEYVCNTQCDQQTIAKIEVEGCDFAKLHAAYTAYKRERRQMDFGDLLTFANRALEKVPALLQEYRARYDYYQVDEAQDTSPIQQHIVDRLAGAQGNLFLVGDEDQSIYGFRGADPGYLLRFEQAHPGARVMMMELNYRSCPQIVEAGARVIAYNAYRRRKEMQASRTAQGIVEKEELRDWSAQGAAVAERAASLAPGRTLGVLFRNNDSLPALCDALLRAGVPFTISRRDGKPALFTHYTLHSLRSIMRLSYNPTDGQAFYDLRRRIWRGIPTYIAERIRRSGEDVFEQLIGEMRLTGSDAEAVRRRAQQVASYKTLRAYPAVSRMVDEFHLDSRQNRAKTDALLSLAMGVETLDEYKAKLDELELMLDSDPPRGGRVFLSTIHAAKGLEYDEVMLVDGMEGVLPASTKTDTPEERMQMEEETRLMYVAVTRARDRFTFLAAAQSHGSPAKPSVFLDRLLPPPRTALPPQSARGIVRNGLTNLVRRMDRTAVKAAAWEGSRVRHVRFGVGRVIAVREGMAEIRFADGERILDLRVSIDGGLITRLRD